MFLDLAWHGRDGKIHRRRSGRSPPRLPPHRTTGHPTPRPAMRLSTAHVLAFSALLSSAVLGAQEKAPNRPKLPAGADTNDAHAYYDFALSKLNKDDDAAADALYWSTRLEPMWADAFYARRIALLLSDPRRLENYWF